jgi:hypothetical protein
MGSPLVSRWTFAAVATVGAVGCANTQPDTPEATNEATNEAPTAGTGSTKAMFLHGQARLKPGESVKPFSHPPGAHLQYFGGRIVSNISVVQVIYGTGNYIPEVLSTGTPSMASFYQGVLNSAYVDWLTEYNTVGQPPPTSNQTLGRGSFSQQVTITPSAINNGSVIDDLNIQAELSAQIAAGTLPAPTHDAAGNNNTYYAISFPHGKIITLGGAASCQVFCAYHGTIANAGGHGEIEYGVLPDFQPGSGCEFGCGAAQTQFGNYTQVASHELIETMTDPEVGLATVFGPPLAWADLVFSEIGDICNDQNGQVVGGDGVTYDVQTEFSNSVNDCIVTNPLATPLIATAPAETCRGSTSTATVTVFGGAGRFTSDVTLSLANVNPSTPTITATFDPNPVPTPSSNGASSSMRVATTRDTPAGNFALTIQGTSTSLTSQAFTQFTVRSDAPAAPAPSAPANGADGVPATATFSWSTVPQATTYEVNVFDDAACGGPAVVTVDTGGTNVTLSDAQALKAFHTYSWTVSAANACGPSASSACFTFRTASCSDPQELITNGGFENGFGSWSIDATVPPVVLSGAHTHSGANAAAIGTFDGFVEPLGDAQISQTLTFAPGSQPKLSFWEWPLTTDIVVFDQQYVRVQPISPPGPVVVLMNEARNDQTFILRQFDMSQFAGMTVKLIFGVHQDGFGDITGMFIDDVSVTSQNCGPPDFKVTVTPSTAEACAGSSTSYNVAVASVNGPNFTSQVNLSTTGLPPGATGTFARNPIGPGESTTLTVSTARPTSGTTFAIHVVGTAVTPPPDGTRTASATLLVDPNAPNAPETISPRNGEVNTPRRPTLSWTAPFIPESPTSAASTAGASANTSTRLASQGAQFMWQLAGTTPPKPSTKGDPAGVTPANGSGVNSNGAASPSPFAFGTATYHLQIATDAGFSHIVIDTNVNTNSFTVPVDLNIATLYFWRVSAVNACGTSPFSATASFIVGACFEGWGNGTAFPTPEGPLQETVIGSPANNKLYVIGGGFGPGPNLRTNQTWAFDPQSNTWTRKADVPAPGIGSNFGSGTRIGNSIYVFGGVNGPPGVIAVHRFAWRYDITGDTWTRLADLPTDNFGSAVGAIGGKIYLAYGTGFVTQTWQYDPATDTYTRKADAPVIPQTFRLHGAVFSGELHAFAGGFEGSAHVVYNAATDTWRTAALMPFTATDPAVDVFTGKIYVVGGRPTAHTHVYDPATNTWSQGATVTGATTGVDNTAGAALGASFYLVGGFNGTDGQSNVFRFHGCSLGNLSSATLIPFVSDNSTERSSVLIDNSISGAPMSVSCFLYGTGGDVLGSDTFSVAPNELKTVADVVRALTHTTGVQNKVGSVALFGTEVFHAMGSMANNTSSDPAIVDGASINGTTSGWVSTIGTSGYLTQTAFTNASASTSVVTVLAYPAAGGSAPVAATVVVVPPHGMQNFANILTKLGLAATFSGQLSWTSSFPMVVMARDVGASGNARNFSGIEPAHTAADASSNVGIAYVEDTTAYSTALEISNPGGFTANVSVRFVETSDATGGSSGTEHSRDIPVAINSGQPIANIVRWAQSDTSTSPSGKHGFLVVTTPQSITAQARITNLSSKDVVIPESNTAISSGFSPLLIRVEPLPFSQVGMAAATVPTSTTRFAAANPGSSPVTVTLTAFNATGSVAGTFSVTVAPDGQYFTENLAAAMNLPPVFLGWVTVGASGPVQVYNHRITGDGGSAVPVH